MSSSMGNWGRQPNVMPCNDALVSLRKQALPLPLNNTLPAHFAENCQQIQTFANNFSSTLANLAEYGASLCRELMRRNEFRSCLAAHDPETDLPASIGYEGDSYSPDCVCLAHRFRHAYYQDPYTGNFYYVSPFSGNAYGQNRGYNHHMGHSYQVVYNRDLFRNDRWRFDPYYIDSYHHPPGNYYLHPRPPQPNCRNSDVIYRGLHDRGNQQRPMSSAPTPPLNVIPQRPRSVSQTLQRERDRAQQTFRSEHEYSQQPVQSKRGHRKHGQRKSPPSRRDPSRRDQGSRVESRHSQARSIGSATTSSSRRRPRSRRARSRRVHSKRHRHKQQRPEGRSSERRSSRGQSRRGDDGQGQEGCRSKPWCSESFHRDFGYPGIPPPPAGASDSAAKSGQCDPPSDLEFQDTDWSDDDAVYVGPCYRDDCEGDIYYRDPWQGKFYHRESFSNAHNSGGSGGDNVPGAQ